MNPETQPAPTPETDNHSLLFRTAGVGYAYGHLLPLARKLERERDEALFRLSAYSVNPDRIGQTEIAMARTANSTLAEVIAERDQLKSALLSISKLPGDGLAQRIALSALQPK